MGVHPVYCFVSTDDTLKVKGPSCWGKLEGGEGGGDFNPTVEVGLNADKTMGGPGKNLLMKLAIVFTSSKEVMFSPPVSLLGQGIFFISAWSISYFLLYCLLSFLMLPPSLYTVSMVALPSFYSRLKELAVLVCFYSQSCSSNVSVTTCDLSSGPQAPCLPDSI